MVVSQVIIQKLWHIWWIVDCGFSKSSQIIHSGLWISTPQIIPKFNHFRWPTITSGFLSLRQIYITVGLIQLLLRRSWFHNGTEKWLQLVSCRQISTPVAPNCFHCGAAPASKRRATVNFRTVKSTLSALHQPLVTTWISVSGWSCGAADVGVHPSAKWHTESCP